jgi:hypothetical protein
MGHGWVGVDLDGTLAEYHGWQGAGHIGDPIPEMMKKVKKWLADGNEVKIFTARVSSKNPDREEAMEAIKKWSRIYIGRELDITAEKDYGMIELWDDRCIQVVPNTGIPVQGYGDDIIQKLREAGIEI